MSQVEEVRRALDYLLFELLDMRLSCPLGSVGNKYRAGPATERSSGNLERKTTRPMFQTFQQ